MSSVSKAYLLLFVDSKPPVVNITVNGDKVRQQNINPGGVPMGDLRKIGAGIYGDKLITMDLTWRSYVVLEREGPTYGDAQDELLKLVIGNPYYTWLEPFLAKDYGERMSQLKESM